VEDAIASLGHQSPELSIQVVPRWKRIGDYLLGRSTLIGIASLMLLFISGYATWHGMQDFIVGVSGSSADTSDGLSISNDLLVVLVVAALTFLMWLALRETFGSHRRFTERLITIPLYLFLAIWSIGFGYGFWWSLIARRRSHSHRSCGATRGCTRCEFSDRRAPRRRPRSAGQRGVLVREPDEPGGEQRWELRHGIWCRTRPFVQRAARCA